MTSLLIAPETKRETFRREADMLSPLLQGISAAGLPRLGEPFFEVQTLRGIADVVFAHIDDDVMAYRNSIGLKAVTEISEVRTLRVLGVAGDSAETLPIPAIAAKTGISAGHLRANVLPRLIDSGWLAEHGRGWQLTATFRSPVRSMVSLEVKRTDWKRALMQANAYTEFSDQSFVAMDHSRLRDTEVLKPAFDFAGVGLLTIRQSNEGNPVENLLPARRRRPRGFPHAVVAERIGALIEANSRSGYVGPVFGQFLTTTSGLDPRFSWQPVR